MFCSILNMIMGSIIFNLHLFKYWIIWQKLPPINNNTRITKQIHPCIYQFKVAVIPSFQAFGPTLQQFQWPLIETLLKSPLQQTKVQKTYKHNPIRHLELGNCEEQEKQQTQHEKEAIHNKFINQVLLTSDYHSNEFVSRSKVFSTPSSQINSPTCVSHLCFIGIWHPLHFINWSTSIKLASNEHQR